VTAQEYAFAVIAAVGSISAIAVVTARNVVHAALYLVVALLSVGATFLLLGAEFAGWVQILIYVGAIVILFLFGLMLTKAPSAGTPSTTPTDGWGCWSRPECSPGSPS